MQTQPVQSQKGEIEFRRRLYLKQVEGKTVLDDEYDASGIQNILEGRMNDTRNQMTLLQGKGIPLSPYVEIGAERCQRSLVMENDLGAQGAAIDISYDLLKSCAHYQSVFKRSKAPLRICCDANNLPFMSGSIPFVFCYETLHHFPEPAPITKEIHRVLAPGGYFFFDEEPYEQILHINLYKGKKIYSEQFLKRGKIRKILDRFFCVKTCNELEYGVIENHSIPVRAWKRAFSGFDGIDVDLKATRSIQSELFNPSSYIKYFAAYLLGGGISGICRKGGAGGGDVDRQFSRQNILICPSCRQAGSEKLLGRKNGSYICPECSKRFPVIDGVSFLFAYEKFVALYPEVLDSFLKGGISRQVK